MLNRRGFSLFELVFVAGVLAFVAALSGGIISNIISAQKLDTFQQEMTVLRDFYKRILEDPVARAATIAANGQPPAAWTQFTPRERDGSIAMNFNPATPTNGFDATGRLCNTYSVAAPNVNCPARFNFQWRDAAGSCVDASGNTLPNCTMATEIRIVFQISVPQNSIFQKVNPDRLSMTLRIDGDSAMATDSLVCPAGQAVVSFDANGAAQCEDRAALLSAPPPPPPPPPPTGPGPGPTGPGPGPTGPGPTPPAPPPLKSPGPKSPAPK